MLYRQKNSRYWWIDYKRGSTRIRKSTRCTNLEEAKIVEGIALAAAHQKTKADFIHALVDQFFGKVSETGVPCTAIWSEYQSAMAATGKTVSRRTEVARKTVCADMAKFFGGRIVDKITPPEARDYATTLARRMPNAKTRKNHICNIITVLRALGIPTDAWRAVIPRVQENRRDDFTRDEERRVLEAAKAAGNHWYALSLMSRHTGLREGDCVRMDWANMDTETRCIRVCPSKTARHGIEVVLPIPEDAWNAIVSDAAPCGPDGRGRLFPDWHKRPLFADVLKAADVTDGQHTFHSWRHTFRTRLSEAGVPDEIAMRLGGWTQRSTASRYDHAERVDELRAAVEKAAK